MDNKAINTSADYFKYFKKALNVKPENEAELKKESEVLPDDEILGEALKCALDVRKFEIDLYWKRASYFWVLIGAALVAYVAVVTKGSSHVAELSVAISCLGFVFSCAWLAVNKGSKFWQENWEAHVDMLEDRKMGSLYKIVFNKSYSFLSLGGKAYSVSRINLVISFYVAIVWLGLFAISSAYIWFPDFVKEYVGRSMSVVAVISAVICVYFLFFRCNTKINFLDENGRTAKATCRPRHLS